MLFSIFLSALDENIKSMLMKFVNDTKIGGVVNNEEYRSLIQTNVGCLISWVQANKRHFNTAKFKITL